MSALDVLLSRRWIVKARDRELYYQVREGIGQYRKFIAEKLGYQLIINPYLIKLEKIPSFAMRWMGIDDFSDPIEYVFLCLILMFLEDKEVEEQFVLHEIAEYVQSNCHDSQVDWTLYSHRRHLIKVMRFCVSAGMIDVNDGSDEDFAQSEDSEVLYENTGASRYFMRSFARDISGYTSIDDFQRAEWIGLDEARGIVRRQRVYRSLLMTPGLQNSAGCEEDFAYIKNFRNMIQGDIEELFDCELQVYRSGAYLVLGENCRIGECIPQENTMCDIFLLFCTLVREGVKKREISPRPDESVALSKEIFRTLAEKCKASFGHGFPKTYREMTNEELSSELYEWMENRQLLSGDEGEVVLSPICGKMIGCYPEEFGSKDSDKTQK